MLMLTKSLSKGSYLLLAIAVTAGIAYLSLAKISITPPVKIDNFDKFLHAFAYFALAFSWLLFSKKSKQNNATKYLIVTSCVIYGIIIEVLQMKATSYRTGDYLDIIANSVGIFLALLISNLINKKNNIN